MVILFNHVRNPIDLRADHLQIFPTISFHRSFFGHLTCQKVRHSGHIQLGRNYVPHKPTWFTLWLFNIAMENPL
jgi:hypothetical protein